MSYRIAQDFKYVGKNYWRWWAWIEADDAELDKVRQVVWILHPSFEPARVIAEQRSDKFRLETAGWGTFLLRAEVMLVDGGKQALKHNLRLEYPEPSETPPLRSAAIAPASRSPTIYLSYSAQDKRVAAELRAGLENAGLQVLDQTRLAAGTPWSEALRRMIEQSDAVVALVGADEISPFVSADIKAAIASSKPTLVLRPAGTSSVGLPTDVRVVTIDMDYPDPLAAVVSFLRSLGFQ